MADGDYERGRGREIAAIAAYLKRHAASCKRMTDSSRSGVLVLNGWAASPHAWDLCTFRRDRLFSYVDQLDGLPEKWFDSSVLSPDLPSSAQPSIPNPRSPAPSPQSLIPNTQHPTPNTRFILVGWSMGGSMALRLASRFPGRIAGLVLLAATPRMMEERESGWRGMNARRLDALRKGLEITHGEGFFGVPEGKPNPYMMDTPENLERGLQYLLDTDIRADLERLFNSPVPNPQSPIPNTQHPTPNTSFPVFVFQSERDGIVRPENAAYLRTVFPQARVTMVPGTEHALPIMIPKEIDDAVDACLAVAAKG